MIYTNHFSLSKIPAGESCARCVSSLDGSFFAIRTNERTIEIYNVSKGNTFAHLDDILTVSEDIGCFQFTKDGSSLLVGTLQGTIYDWSLDAGQFVGRLDLKSRHLFSLERVQSIQFSRGSRWIIVGNSCEESVIIFRLRPGNLTTMSNVSGHCGKDGKIKISCDGRVWACFSMIANTVTYGPSGKVHAHSFDGHAKRVVAFEFSPANRYFASGTMGGEVKLWSYEEIGILGSDMVTIFLECILPTKIRGLLVFKFSPDGSLLAIASRRGGTVEIWNVKRGSRKKILDSTLTRIDDLSFSPDGRVLMAWSRGTELAVWDVTSGRLVEQTNVIALPKIDYHLHFAGSKYYLIAEQGYVGIWQVIEQ
jgi:WD40 repeat protein